MRVAVAALLLLAGAATGLCTVVLHEIWWGFAIAAGVTVVALVGIGGGWLTRLPFAVGWVAVAAGLLPQRPEGDYLVASNPPGYLLMGFGLLVLMFAVATLPRPGRGSTGNGRDAS
jgi:hypothetical protein